MTNAENMPRPQPLSLTVLPGDPPEPCPELLTEAEDSKHAPAKPDDRINQVNADPLLDAATSAIYLGLVGVVKHPAQAVRALCRKRRLRSTKVAGKVMIRRSWLEEYIGENVRDVYQRNA